MAISSILIGAGVRASDAERSAPASAFIVMKIGHGGGADQSARSDCSLCGLEIAAATSAATTATTQSSLRHDTCLYLLLFTEVPAAAVFLISMRHEGRSKDPYRCGERLFSSLLAVLMSSSDSVE